MSSSTALSVNPFKDKSQILAILSGITFAVTEIMPWPPSDKKLHAEVSSPEYKRKSSPLGLFSSSCFNFLILEISFEASFRPTILSLSERIAIVSGNRSHAVLEGTLYKIWGKSTSEESSS